MAGAKISDSDTKTILKWSSQIPATAAFGSGWWTSHSYYLETPHRCQLNICLRINKSQGLDIAIRKNSWEVLWEATIMLTVDGNTYSTCTDKWSEYCTIFDVVKAERLAQYRGNSVLLDIACEIIWLGLVDNLIDNEIRPPSPAIRDLDYFLTNTDYSDVLIEVGGESLRAHKIILAGQSPKFFKMLHANEHQNLSGNKVLIQLPEGIHIDHMKIVLKYLYTGRDEALDNLETALKILAIAESCEISKLKYLCVYKLYKMLNFDNALLILDAADDYKATDLRVRVINFIASNKNNFINLNSFQKLCIRKPALSFQIFTSMVSE